MKVFIADDEVIVRIGMKSIIDWEKYGHEVVGEAENGEEAYNKVLRLHPDLVITDIKMPVTDGIELIRKIKEYDPDIKIIVLSGYGEYSLVRDAMKLGAEDYLLKLETDPKKLLKILNQLEERTPDGDRDGISRPIKEQLTVLQELFFKDVITSKISKKTEFKKSRELLKLRLNDKKLYCMVVKINEYYKFENTRERDLITLVKSVKNLIKECLEDVFTGYCFEVKTGEFALFFSVVEDCDKNEVCEYEIKKTAQNLKEMIRKYLDFTVVIGVGAGGTSVTGIREAFALAIKALESVRSRPKCYLLFWKDIPEMQTSVPDLKSYSVLRYKNDIFQSLARHDQSSLKGIIKEIIREISKDNVEGGEYARIATEMVYLLSEYFSRYEVNPDTVLKSGFTGFKELQYLESAAQIEEWMNNVLVDLSEYMKNDTCLHPKIIERAKEYIRKNYSEQITLNKIACQIHLNPNYFCSLFKKYEGIGCVDYLNGVRIEQAKRMLRRSDLKIYEIAFKIGFQNNNYFNRLFKKQTGYTPSEYRELNIV
jgi:two-component system response regulator YesN